ncbi:MAG: WD40/YVTN/BNR-like repeat-containing protein [Flavisolibacter sp.]
MKVFTSKQSFLLGFILLCSGCIYAQFDSALFDAMQWRMIGPHRGGRTIGAVGVPQQPNVFYIGVNNGGVWKTTDYGRTWFPIFDGQPTGSIGDLVVAPSNPNVIYVGSGEGVQRPDLSVGDGMYKSIDGGKNWVHLGLKDVQQIGGLAIDAANENRVFVAALGHPYGPNTERGVYRTLDGGKTWEKVLYKDENTGAIQVAIDPVNPNIIYADLWAARQGPWENGAWNGKGSGLFKSTDGGNTWKQLTNGLPTTQQGLGRIGFCIAPSDPDRMYATVDAGQYGGVYRSDDAGENWIRIQTDNRLWGRGDDFAEVTVDPKNKDVVYSANVVTWKSTNGGKTWDAFRGAPGGDDYHRVWINPNNSDIILIASDQGAIVTVNGGQTFSSWYNQPTAQFYHVSTDNGFPYNVYGGQQESGSVGIASRGNDGQITFREWHPVGAEEYGYVAADPLNSNIIYGGKISKFDKRTGQTQNIAPEAVRSGKYRFVRTAPLLFSPVDHRTLFYAGNVLFKTNDGGSNWKIISPDLSRESWDVPSSVGIYATDNLKSMPRRGVIYTVAPSYKDINTIWCGTDDGLIHLTKDGGKTWKNVTPAAITAWSKVSIIDASHFDVNTAYAAINRIRLDDMRPHIYKTMDGGKTWKEIVAGLPNDPINVVREDPVRKGLLFAGSETAVYVSFDDGERWQSLRLNMPATSIRDLVIKDDDLVVGTHGRSFWILDDITPLRQLTKQSGSSEVILYKPQTTYRVRWNMNTDTPLPQEEPAGQNPPDGAIIDYYLADNTDNEVRLEIKDAKGNIVRKFSSSDTLYNIPENNVPSYWLRPQQILSNKEGAHRFIWDLHYQPLNMPPSFPIAAIYKNTVPRPTSPYIMPGTYTAQLSVNGKKYQQTFVVKMDPRVKTSLKDLQLQHDLSLTCYKASQQIKQALKEMNNSKQQSKSIDVVNAIAKLEGQPRGNGAIGFNQLSGNFMSLLNLLQESDMPPTNQAMNAVKETQTKLQNLMLEWQTLKRKLK